MKAFELSQKANKKGKRKFKVILYKIHPDSCVDEVNQVGTLYNRNGITWIKEYCEAALDSIKGMSLRCEFLDEDRTEIHGHGDTGIADGMMTFENAVVLGTFTKGYIADIENDNGETMTVCIGEGEIDAQCYHNFVTKLDEDLANGYCINGSVEISHTEDNDGIIYKYGYKDKGRIPMVFDHTGYALLGVTPADENAMLVELNKRHKEDMHNMSREEMQALAIEISNLIVKQEAEINACKEACEAQIATANAATQEIENEKNELIATVEQLKAALDAVKKEHEETCKKFDELWEERKALEEALVEARAKERLGELSQAISAFSDSEQEYAAAEIEEFKADPINHEVNAVVDKILVGIGKAAKATEQQKIAEQNSLSDIDIFGEISDVGDEDESIF